MPADTLFTSAWMPITEAPHRRRELCFPEAGLADYLDLARVASARGAKTLLLHPFNTAAKELAQSLAQAVPGLELFARPGTDNALSAGVRPLPTGFEPDVTLLTENEPEALSACLMAFLDCKAGLIVAPRCAHYFAHRSLFLISIPKSGTHLLYRLAEIFGYHRGVVCPDDPAPQTWYCIEYSNSHTVARDFFVDSVRRAPFGNRYHPFMRSPSLFIYRNPLDIVVSEANYYHRSGKTAFSGYFGKVDFSDRLYRLIGHDWLMGDIRSRIGGFIPWLDLPNVIPVAFEELIGAQGGGDDSIQSALIWSLQLKLHVPGVPEAFGEQVFDRNSATFNEGRIGGFRGRMDGNALRRFFRLPQDFMEAFGYSDRPTNWGRGLLWRILMHWAPEDFARRIHTVPSRVDAFRARPLICEGDDFGAMPITVVGNYLDLYNIVRYRGKYLAIPHGMEGVDLDEFIASPPKGVYVRNHVERLKRLVDAHYLELARDGVWNNEAK